MPPVRRGLRLDNPGHGRTLRFRPVPHRAASGRHTGGGRCRSVRGRERTSEWRAEADILADGRSVVSCRRGTGSGSTSTSVPPLAGRYRPSRSTDAKSVKRDRDSDHLMRPPNGYTPCTACAPDAGPTRSRPLHPVLADARAAAAGAARLCERARSRSPEGVAEQEPAHQRECGAGGLPARKVVRHQAFGPLSAGRNYRSRPQHPDAAEPRRTSYAMTTVEQPASALAQTAEAERATR